MVHINHSENIQFDSQELSVFNDWKASMECTDLKMMITKSFDLAKLNLDNDLDIMLYQTPYANGVYFEFIPEISLVSRKFLAHYCKEVLLENNYMLYRAIRETDFKDKKFKKLEKWYLKPYVEFDDAGLMKQRFGNISIEVKYNERDCISFKLLANIYSDRNYGKFDSFESLISILFSA
jgi:hypothetical protein